MPAPSATVVRVCPVVSLIVSCAVADVGLLAEQDSSDDSSDDDVAGEKGKATLKSKLKKAGKNVTWDENN